MANKFDVLQAAGHIADIDVLPALGLDGWQQLDARTFAVDYRPAQTLVEQLLDSGYSFGRGNQAQLPFAGAIRRQ